MAFSDWVKAAVARILQRPNSTAPADWNPDNFDAEAFVRKLLDQRGGDGFLSSGTPEEAEQFAKKTQELLSQLDRHVSLKTRMIERIPEHLFPRTPPIISARYPNNANFQEDLWIFWEDIEAYWSEQPTSDDERQQREALYWRQQAEAHSFVSGQNVRQLKPKQEIIEFWWDREKWVFRQYYAATGVAHRSVFEDPLLTVSLQTYLQVKDAKDHAGLPLHRELTDKTFSVVQTYITTIIPQHKERWGEWFFFNIDQAFKKTYVKPDRNFSRPSEEL